MTHELCRISPCIIPGKTGASIDKSEQVPGREVLLDRRDRQFVNKRYEYRRCGPHCHDKDVSVLAEGTVELYDAIFSSKEKQGVQFSDTTLHALPIILRHRLEGIKKSGTLLSNELYCTRSPIAQQSDRRKVVELHR
jgi:hypothetical protein